MDPVIERFSRFFNIDPSPGDVAELESMFREYEHGLDRDVGSAWITYYYFAHQSRAIKKQPNLMNQFLSLLNNQYSNSSRASKAKIRARTFFFSKFDPVSTAIVEFERLCAGAKPPVPDRVVEIGKSMLMSTPITIPVSARTIAKGLFAAIARSDVSNASRPGVMACKDEFRKILGGGKA